MESGEKAYEILIAGAVGPDWEDWFDGMEIQSTGPDETLITGRVKDQAALRGLLDRINDLNLSLISVNRVKEEETK